VIVPADKGCATVILNREDYHQKIESHLNDAETYVAQENDCSVDQRKMINSYLK
jgi:hypothetical protein